MDKKTMTGESLDLVQLQASLLGSLLKNPQKAGQIMAQARPEDFESPWRQAFETMRDLHFGGDPIDRVTLLHAMGDDSSELVNTLAALPGGDPLTYCRMLHERATHERIRAEALGLVHSQTLEEARACMDRLNLLTVERPGIRTVTMQDAVMDFLNRLEARRNQGPVKYLDWGMDYITDHLDAEPGDYIVIGGYPSAGKTLLALQMVQTIAKQYRTGFYSFETKEKKLTDRMMSYASGVPLWRIKHNDLRESDYRALTRASEALYSLPFSVTEAAGMTTHDVLAEALNRRQQVIFIDYLQLIRQKGSSRYEKVTEISQDLHTMAQEHGIMVIALAQLSRPEKSQKEGKPVPPGMSSLRESGQIEQDADAILILYPEDPTKGNSNRILKFAKNKEGEIPRPCNYAFKGEIQTFEELFPERKPTYKSNKKKPGQDYQQGEMNLP